MRRDRVGFAAIVSVLFALVLGSPVGAGAATLSQVRAATPVAAKAGTVPTQPLMTSVSGDGLAVLAAWLPNDRAEAVTGYTVTATPKAGVVTAVCPTPAVKTITRPASDSGAWVAGLCEKVPYQLTMTASNAAGTSVVSAPSPWVVPLPASAPKAPQLVQVLGRSGALRLAWSPSAFNGGKPVSAYLVKVKKGTTLVKSVTTTAKATSASVTGLVNGTTYTVTVQAKNAVGASGVSTMTGKPSPVYPASAPTQISARPDGTGKVVLAWAAPVDDGGAAVSGFTVTWQQVDQAGVVGSVFVRHAAQLGWGTDHCPGPCR